MVVFSDGVSEALNDSGEEFGDDGIVRAVGRTVSQSPAAILDALLAAVKQFTGAAPQNDDITALVLRYRT